MAALQAKCQALSTVDSRLDCWRCRCCCWCCCSFTCVSGWQNETFFMWQLKIAMQNATAAAAAAAATITIWVKMIAAHKAGTKEKSIEKPANKRTRAKQKGKLNKMRLLRVSSRSLPRSLSSPVLSFCACPSVLCFLLLPSTLGALLQAASSTSS